MKLKFETISPVILSPRMEKALYKNVDFKGISEDDMVNLETEKKENINIIYPFYSYEDRNLLYERDFSYAKEYYIPASSLKGALLENKKEEKEDIIRSGILFKDVRIDASYIRLRNLYKFQYLYQGTKEKADNKKQESVYKTPKFTPFFAGIVIEMLERNTNFENEILFKSPEISEEFFRSRLQESFAVTKKKLKNYITETECRIKDIQSWIEGGKIKKQKDGNAEYIDKLRAVKSNLEDRLNDENMIFLGGYKGILAGLSQLDETHKIQNGFYIDKHTLLPYGLVKVALKEK